VRPRNMHSGKPALVSQFVDWGAPKNCQTTFLIFWQPLSFLVEPHIG
jgi:hypothetical protein